jgi:hypothetical protein
MADDAENGDQARPASSSDSAAHAPTIAVAVAIIAWLGLLAIREGSTYDQNEHAHVAWALNNGLRLNHDLVEHHLPLWWYVLRLYPLAGAETGLEILRFARGVVVLIGALFVAALWGISRSAPPAEPRSLPWPAWLTALFVMLTAETLWCSRPEPMALTLVALAVLCARNATACAPKSRSELAYWVLGGAAFALAVAATPRGVLFSGFLLLGLPPDRWRVWKSPRVCLAVSGGGLAVAAFMLVATDMSIAGTLWDMRLSKALMVHGLGARAIHFETIIASGVLPAALFVLGGLRWRPWVTLLRFAYCGALLAVMLALQSRYLWPHSLGAALMSFPLMLAAHFADAPRRSSIIWRSLERTWPVIAVLAVGWAFHSERWDRHNGMERRLVRGALDEIAAGRKVAIPYFHHPVSAPDGSRHLLEYGPAHARPLCLAIASLAEDRPFPSCDFVADLRQNEPVLIDAAWLETTLSEDEQQELVPWVAAGYAPRFMSAGRYVPRFWVRKDLLDAYGRVAAAVGERGIEELEAMVAADDVDLARARVAFSQVLFRAGDREAALAALEPAVEVLMKHEGASDPAAVVPPWAAAAYRAAQ